ncbi:hypothetical protein MVEN_01985300 [Mycena venus]|uniref:Uncharacterized protein n=1 Tax=Mycena venus TaxID=2733690 RepID=A0A8H6XE78_9AGAR|nr:hypothetical protein MVEN_01985300 [Mycena venus]
MTISYFLDVKVILEYDFASTFLIRVSESTSAAHDQQVDSDSEIEYLGKKDAPAIYVPDSDEERPGMETAVRNNTLRSRQSKDVLVDTSSGTVSGVSRRVPGHPAINWDSDDEVPLAPEPGRYRRMREVPATPKKRKVKANSPVDVTAHTRSISSFFMGRLVSIAQNGSGSLLLGSVFLVTFWI